MCYLCELNEVILKDLEVYIKNLRIGVGCLFIKCVDINRLVLRIF